MTAETRWTMCILCDGTGQVHDYNIYNLEGSVSCPDCGGLGEIEYIPVPIRRVKNLDNPA